MKKLVRNRCGYGLIGIVALAVAVFSPVWTGEAYAAQKKDVEITSKLKDSKATDSSGNTYWDLGTFEYLLGNARTMSDRTELDFNKVTSGDEMGDYARDLRVFREIGNYIPRTAQEEKYLYLNGLNEMVDRSSNINMVTKDKGKIKSMVTKAGERFKLTVPEGVDKKDGVVWMVLSGVEGYPFVYKYAGDKKETLVELDTYISILWNPAYIDEEEVILGEDGSATIISDDAEYATTYFCFSTTKTKNEYGYDDYKLEKMVAAYNVAFESDLRINEDNMELTKTARLGDKVQLSLDISSSKKDKLQIEWGSFTYGELSNSENKLSVTINPVTIKDIGLCYAYITDGAVNKMVCFFIEQDPNDKYPVVANLKTLKVAAYNEKAVKLTWNKAANAKKYAIYQWNGSKWVALGNTSNNYYLVKNLKAGQAYKFAVRPYQNYYGVNVKSQTFKAVNAFTIPAKISKITVTKRESTQVSLKWNAASGAKGYVVYQYYKNKWVKIGTTSSNAGTVRFLSRNTSYYFAVRPYTMINGKTVYASSYTKVKTSTTR